MIRFRNDIWRRYRGALVVAAVIAAFALGLLIRRGGTRGPGAPPRDPARSEAAQAQIWTCSMHPNIRMPEPGRCPICGMDLVPVVSGETGEELGPREIELSAAARRLAEIRTAPVERRNVPVTIRLAGKIETDETRESKIAAWVPGRLERLFVDYTGRKVEKGAPLFELYSPELLTAQQELLAALEAERAAAGSSSPGVRETARRTTEAAREKLRLWGLARDQIEEIERRGSPSDRIVIAAPSGGTVVHKNAVEGMYVQTGAPIYTIADLSRLWVMLDAYESDLAWIRKGQEVSFTTEAYAGESFAGTVAFVDPEVDPRTRAVRVRVEVANPGERLKPGMFVRAAVRAQASSGRRGRMPLVIPSSAPLVTGTRAVVYVEKPGAEGRYEGREIVLGPRAGDYYVVREGLAEGEMVVVNGAFKIDSEIQIRAKPSMMSPKGAAPPVHRHDAGAARPAPARAGAHAPGTGAEKREPGRHEIPMEFQRQLAGVFTAYFETHKALSRDGFGEAKKAAGRFVRALDAVNMGLLSHAAHGTWMEDSPPARASAAGIAAARDIAAARAGFEPLSEAMFVIAKSFGIGAEDSIFRIHCPMAFDDRGAAWLQTRTVVENPYFGSRMFKCGSVTDTILGGSPRSHE